MSIRRSSNTGYKGKIQIVIKKNHAERAAVDILNNPCSYSRKYMDIYSHKCCSNNRYDNMAFCLRFAGTLSATARFSAVNKIK